MFVPRDLAKRWTDMVLLGPRKVYDYFGGGYNFFSFSFNI